MSNPFKEEARKTNRAKLSKEGVHGKDSEDSYARAQRIAKGYADGGAVADPVSSYRVRRPTSSQMDAIRSAATPPAPVTTTQGST